MLQPNIERRLYNDKLFGRLSFVDYMSGDYIFVRYHNGYSSIKFLGRAWEIVEYDAGAWPEILHI